jgi:hypothetical protein
MSRVTELAQKQYAKRKNRGEMPTWWPVMGVVLSVCMGGYLTLALIAGPGGTSATQDSAAETDFIPVVTQPPESTTSAPSTSAPIASTTSPPVTAAPTSIPNSQNATVPTVLINDDNQTVSIVGPGSAPIKVSVEAYDRALAVLAAARPDFTPTGAIATSASDVLVRFTIIGTVEGTEETIAVVVNRQEERLWFGSIS